MPKSNVDYWVSKIERNRDRDRETNELLRDAGWTVLRFWEHESPADVADAVTAAVASAQPITGRSQKRHTQARASGTQRVPQAGQSGSDATTSSSSD
ncbi:hypothetical protein MSA03_23070 [Microbacterium saccharophilum]|nr:hypothetical protein MSA03_23070 [Microbacterium saccharophilum]